MLDTCRTNSNMPNTAVYLSMPFVQETTERMLVLIHVRFTLYCDLFSNVCYRTYFTEFVVVYKKDREGGGGIKLVGCLLIMKSQIVEPSFYLEFVSRKKKSTEWFMINHCFGMVTSTPP